MYGGLYMFMKIPPKGPLGVLTMSETISRLTNLELSRSSAKRPRCGSVLTENELQSLRAEMIRDGAYMKEWISLKLGERS